MSIHNRFQATDRAIHSAPQGSKGSRHNQEAELARWGGIAGIGGVAFLIGSGIAVAAWGLPDASDLETLTDYPNLKTGRTVEHIFYLGAVTLFALHVSVLRRVLKKSHRAAATFAAVLASFGLVVMAASAVLHVSTSPLFDLYDDPAATPADQQSIEYAWHGAQSVFDTMLATGVLLVPIGIALFGVAMRRSVHFSSAMATGSIALGLAGVAGATIAVIDPGSLASAASVLAIAAFHAMTGWRTFALGRENTIHLSEEASS